MKTKSTHLLITLTLGAGLTLALLWMLPGSPPVHADPGTLYVTTDGSDTNDCSTIANRCRTVQRAVNLAATDDEIWVAGGVYTDADTASLGYVVALTKTVTLRGGWDASFTTQNFASTPTTLDAERAGRVIYVNGSITPTIEGLVIARGDATGWGGSGGGLYSQGASLIVRRSVITDSVASTTGIGFGGGLYLVNTTATLTDTQVLSNTASATSYGWGGGLALDNSTVTLTDTQVLSNTASTGYDGYGGGLSLDSATVNLDSTTSVRSNTASTAASSTSYGGGLYLGDSSMATLSGTQVISNTASTAANSNGYGGGLYISGSTANLSGATVVQDNTASTVYYGYGGGLALSSSSTATLTDTQVVSNTASIGSEGYGGGLYLSGSTASLNNTQVVNNTASTAANSNGSGGGLYLYSSSTANLSGATVVQGNTASTAYGGSGGGLYLDDSTANLNNTQVVSNTATTASYYGYGGGLYIRFNSMANLNDTQVVNNTGSAMSGGGGGGLFIRFNSMVNLTDTQVMSNTAGAASSGYGGGLYISESTANLTNTQVVSNTAGTAGTSSGGGIRISSDSTVTLVDTHVMSNTASTAGAGYGGGLYLFARSTANLRGATIIQGNTASTAGTGYGGGLYISGARATANLSGATVVQGNTASTAASSAGYGGGLALQSSEATANLSGATQVVSNTASTAGTGYGGGLYAAAGSTMAVNNVIARNGKEGLYIDGGSHTFVNNTLSDNTLTGARVNGGTLILTNTIVARHDVGINQTAGTVIAGYTLFSNTVNIMGSVTNNNPVYGDSRFVDAAGGDYHIQASSTAIDQGNPAGTTATGGPAPTTDFDGEGRPVGAWVDIGADEFPAGLSVTKQADPDPVQAGSQLTYTIHVTNTGYVTLTATITDTLPDHVTPTGVLTWTPTITAPGGVWTETVVVTVEMGYTGPLTNVVQITTDEGATGTYTHTATVIPTVSFSNVAYNVNEGAGPAIITVTLSAVSGLTATVDYAADDGTATAGDDYTAASGTLTFTPGTTTLTFTVPITNDDLYENAETVSLTLSDPVSATLGTSNATLTIIENDSAPTVAFSGAAYSVGESAGPAVVTVTLSGDTALTATVDYAADDGTATAGDDYTAVSGTLTFAPGTTTLTFTVPITNDDLYENAETVSLTLSDPVSATLGTSNATLTIIENDSAPTVAFSGAAYSVGESAGPAVVTVTLSGDTALTATVDYAADDGTATAGDDYTAVSGTLTFAPGTTTLTFTVPIANDDLYENAETVSLTLSDPVSATLGTPSSATLTIIENDSAPTVAFSGAAYSVGESAGPAVVTVTLSGDTALTATVDYAAADGTATAGDDYTAASGTLTFTPGTTTLTFTVSITDDGVYENAETVSLTLSDPVSATLGTSNATLTIIENDSASTVAFSGAAYSVGESAGPAVVTVTLSGDTALTATVDYAADDGTATAGDDYTAASGTLTFTPGTTTLTFTVPITNDDLYENAETVSLTLSDPVSATLGTSNATLTIIENDSAPTVAFSGAAYSVGESAGPAVVTVTLSGDTALTATVDYAADDGTATAGDDYTAVSGTLTFAPGTTTLTFTVPIANDDLYENAETVSLTLSDPVSATLGTPSSATLTIIENDSAPTVAFSGAVYSVGESAGPAVVTVTLSGDTALTATVDYAADDGTATAGDDYTAASGTLTFTPGTTTLTFTVPITNDDLYENAETVSLTLSDPVSATLGTSNATLTIIENDSAPTVAFSGAAYSVGESAGPAVVTVTLSGDTALTATVDYAADDGTATVGDDYTAVSGTLTFAPGTTTLTFTVPITNDDLYENAETVSLTLSDPVSATLGTSNATLTIIENDSAPTVTFSGAAYSVGESAGPAVVTVTLSGDTALTATVDYAADDGTATAGDDYTAVSGTLTFAPGTTTLTFTVPIANDDLYENAETVSLTLSDPVSATLGTPSSATLTIIENDSAPTVAFSGAAYSVGESAGPAVVTVTLSGDTALTATVDYAAADGTATAGDDYTAVSGTLTFAPGTTTLTFTVPITNDDLYENAETVSLTLSDPVSATLGTSNATLTIIENDSAPTVAFSGAAYSVGESAGPAVVTVTLSGDTALTATVDYAADDGTATAEDDYTAASGTLTFTPGTTTLTFTVSITDDGVYENDETVLLTLSDPVSATLGTSNATLTIEDDDERFDIYLPLVVRQFP